MLSMTRKSLTKEGGGIGSGHGSGVGGVDLVVVLGELVHGRFGSW
jgi:hypothetical protein